ncbi:MAG TPA: glycosyltransferase family 2 protein [Patescibacteria group bacterium]
MNPPSDCEVLRILSNFGYNSNTMDLSVIIITYKERELLKKCLESVFASKTDYKFEVIVTDSNSQDGSVEMIREQFPQAKVLDNQKNLGFSKGNNVAIKQANGRLILLLNADTTVKPDTFDTSVKYMDAYPEVGALGAKVMLLSGELDKACRRKFPNPVNSFLRLFGLKKFSDYNITSPIDQEVEVDAIMGAYFLVRKSVIDQVGMLDEEFFMYGEDLDWCWRIKEKGHKIMYYPKAEIMHYKYGASKTLPLRTIKWAHTAMKIFYRKHYAQQHNWVFNQFIYLGINLRMYLVLLVNIFRHKKTVH